LPREKSASVAVVFETGADPITAINRQYGAVKANGKCWQKTRSGVKRRELKVPV